MPKLVNFENNLDKDGWFVPSRDMAVPAGLIMELIDRDENTTNMDLPFAVVYRQGLLYSTFNEIFLKIIFCSKNFINFSNRFSGMTIKTSPMHLHRIGLQVTVELNFIEKLSLSIISQRKKLRL